VFFDVILAERFRMSDAPKPRKALPKAVSLDPSSESSKTPSPQGLPGSRPAPAKSDTSAARATPYRRRSRRTPALAAGLVVALLAAGGAGYVLLLRENSPPTVVIAPISPATIDELSPWALTVSASVADVPDVQILFRLAQAPPGAAIDEQTGQITWTPREDQGPGAHEFQVEAHAAEPHLVKGTKRFTVAVCEVNQPPVISAINEQTVKAGSELAVTVQAHDPDSPAAALQYRLKPGSPTGARIAAKSGELRWTPTADTSAQTQELTVLVQEAGRGGLASEMTFRVRVLSSQSPLDLLLAALQRGGASVERGVEVGPNLPKPALGGTPHIVSVNDHPVQLFEYPDAASAQREASQVSTDAAMVRGKPAAWDGVPHLFRKDAFIALYVGTNVSVRSALEGHFGKPFAVGRAETVNVPAVAETRKSDPELKQAALNQAEIKQLVSLYTTNKKLFVMKEYPTLRKIFTDRFEREFQEQIKAGFGAEYDALQSWFAEHSAVKEDLFSAIDPRHDKIPAVLTLFADLKKRFGKKFESHLNLAIATSVVWDDPRGVYDYEHHQRRTRSKMPDGLLGAVENFKFFVDAENYMQGRARFLPWEFLTHLVNHKTPLPERDWAMRNYLPRRTMFGACYQDVPYDTRMLETSGRECKLQDQLYTLQNIKSHGGVCAMQADFAARVGKCLGVPAEYVRGESAGGELHAWVMWVELKQVTENSISFTLESHGRYRGDKYYVGTLEDPQTGKEITDRNLELKLHSVGVNPQAKRQADLIMSAYPLLRNELKMDVEEQLLFLNRVIGISPGDEQAWREIARMSREGVITAKQQKTLRQSLDSLFRVFANFPDFTWEVFNDLVAFFDKPKERNPLYERLIALYVKAGRPDLACEARLKLTEFLSEPKNRKEAVEGLAATIKAFPDEGRYVPRLLDKLEEICKGVEGSGPLLVQFYQSFLPLIPQKRGDRPSPYCMKMYEQGIARFKEHGQPALAQAYEVKLANLRAGKVGKN
jgi:hypothetical protein